MDTLVAASKGDASKLERLQSHVDQLRQGVEVGFLSPAALTQLRQLVYVQEEALNSIAQERILGSLAFDGMHMRYDMVDDANSKTFQWIFHNDSQSDEQDEYGDEENEYDGASMEDELQSVDVASESGDEADGSKPQSIENQRLLNEDTQHSGEDGRQSHIEDSQPGDNERQLGDDDNDQSEEDEHQSEDSDHESEDSDDDQSDEEDEDEDEDEEYKNYETKHHAREVFINWLSSGEGIFHISGKLGSGKSTLMKFLFSHCRTKTELRKWAGKLTYSTLISLTSLLTF
jgi:hypothetical protein